MKTEELIKDIKKDKRFKSLKITTGTDPSLKIEKLYFDVPMLDELLIGGVPVGKQTLIYGDSHVGKTFVIQKLISSAQKQNKSLVYMDIDHTFVPDWWKVVGVDIDNIHVAQPIHGEQAFDLALVLVESGIDLLVIDSIDLLVPTAEAEAEMSNQFMGLQARLIAKGLRGIKRINTKTTFVIANHLREGFGGGRFSQFRIPGGKAQEDFSSIMMWIARGARISENEIKKGGDDKKKVGFKMRVTLEKDKMEGKLYESCEIPFIFEGGIIDTISGLIELSIEEGLILKSGGWYTFNCTKFIDQRYQGVLTIKDLLQENPSIVEELKLEIHKIKEKK